MVACLLGPCLLLLGRQALLPPRPKAILRSVHTRKRRSKGDRRCLSCCPQSCLQAAVKAEMAAVKEEIKAVREERKQLNADVHQAQVSLTQVRAGS